MLTRKLRKRLAVIGPGIFGRWSRVDQTLMTRRT